MKTINHNKGFALLYAILIIFLFMITISAIVFSSLSDIRQYKQVKSSLGAWMVAQSGIEAGLANPTNSSYSCGNLTHVPMDADPLKGYYIVEVCTTPSKYIQSTGVFSGVKIKLRADNYDVSTNIKIYQVGI